MRGGAIKFEVNPEHKELLTHWCEAHATPQQVVKRCRIILQKAAGATDQEIAEEVGVNRHTCRLWRQRFVQAGPEGLWEIQSGRGRKPTAGLAEKIIRATLETRPKAQTHWSTRSLAGAHGIHASTVCRIWQEHQLKPHRQETFKLSRDKEFVPKLLDIVGVYLHPPQNAVVLCIDEKSQIQALDRTQPGLPLKRGRCGTWTHDYVRHGTTTLFAALEVVQGKVVGQCYPKHRHQEFLKFLERLDEEYPVDVELHLVMDNYCTHKHARVKRWLARHPRVKLHFIPTSSSWMNLVERWFAELTGKAVRRGSFSSVPSLIEAIVEFIEQWNRHPKPFVWTAKAEDILAKIERCRRRLEEIQPGCTRPRSPRSKTRSIAV
ncbi:MAG TPA: IS630 family transposase [Verrucomicrobiota bacterium]|nr:IS630 family transposase [Verrucomicrobiota bacterium]HNT13874.1 IS630 family transposase [Verrucomicrobiota bacterium]